MLKGENIICFAGEDWGTHNPLAKTHLLTRLAKQNRVLFIESICIRKPVLSQKDAVRLRNKLSKWIRGIIKTDQGFYVAAPLVIPYHGNNIVDFINKYLLIIQLKIYQYILNLKKPILWICIPTAASIAGKLDEKLLLFHIFDKWDQVPELDSGMRKYIRKQMDILAKKSDLCLTISNIIVEENKHLNSNIHFIDHGVDYEHFGRTLLEETKIPDDIKNISGPIVGYIGNIERGNVDYELIKEIARSRPDWNIVIIAKIYSNFSEFDDFPNIHLLGMKKYKDLPNYLKAFDVCMIPFMVSKWIEACSPLKLKEYLAAGKPVVSTFEPQEEEYREVVYFADSYASFVKRIEDALSDNSPEAAQRRRAVVKNETWDHRVEEISNLALLALKGKK
ncbi:MAG: glycosyltransferase [Candidatus Saganbacteria bacterium]|nr:glycosyltransferase [Candidatus Saganbacteria bacterium]